jgi:uncharacterized protein YcbK (DUF882 family)
VTSRLTARTQLTKNFQWREFADAVGTLPPRLTFDSYVRLCQKYLQPLRDALGPVYVTSGFRSAARNRAVGGAPASRHVPTSEPGAVAADIHVPGRSPREVYAYLEQLRPGGLGLYPTHVHVDNRSVPARW